MQAWREPAPSHGEDLVEAMVMYDFRAQCPEELSVAAGSVVTLIEPDRK